MDRSSGMSMPEYVEMESALGIPCCPVCSNTGRLQLAIRHYEVILFLRWAYVNCSKNLHVGGEVRYSRPRVVDYDYVPPELFCFLGMELNDIRKN